MQKIISLIVYLLKNWYKWWVEILTIIGDIKVYKTPCYILYDNREFDYKLRGKDIRDMDNILQPGDVVLRGYEHYLDGFLIPSKYSHAGIYVGDHTIIHAISEGVKTIDVIDFIQCDRLCVLRPKSGQDLATDYAKYHLGSKYDFRFNTEDSSEFYCFELVAKAYTKLNIQAYPIEFYNIPLKFLSPRYLAESFLDNPNFEKIIEK